MLPVVAPDATPALEELATELGLDTETWDN
jgi:hypothetical protein